MSEAERFEAKGDPFSGRVLRHGRGLPAMIAQTNNLADAEMIARALNNRGAVEAVKTLARVHHDTITPSGKHDPQKREWTECDCKTCRLAQSVTGGR